MREIVFDTETTGLDPEHSDSDKRDKIVEIGMVELIDLVPTGKVFHRYINPMRPMPYEAFRVHGLSDDFLKDFPNFGAPEIVDEMLEFMGDSPLVAHNVDFDRKFINAEMRDLGMPPIPPTRCIDTLLLAKKKFPGAPASLDALCRRFSIDLKDRSLHGALLDAKLLSAVYLELKGGRERSFGFIETNANGSSKGQNANDGIVNITRQVRPQKLQSFITEEEAKAHEAFIAKMGENALWLSNE